MFAMLANHYACELTPPTSLGCPRRPLASSGRLSLLVAAFPMQLQHGSPKGIKKKYHGQEINEREIVQSSFVYRLNFNRINTNADLVSIGYRLSYGA
jgi:hypothetical protein